MKKYNCKVILCGPATGKTYLASHDNRFVDIDNEKAKYKYNLYDKSYDEIEKGKSKRGKTINYDSTEYAINLLKETIDNNKIALITYHSEIIDYLIKNNIKYCLMYADKSLREEYKKRMLDRNNNINFVNSMTDENIWNEFYKLNEEDLKPTFKIKLKEGEYISDYKDKFI